MRDYLLDAKRLTCVAFLALAVWLIVAGCAGECYAGEAMMWIAREFRGWSLAHFILDGAATGLITSLVAIVGSLEWWQTALVAFFAILAFTSGIALWIRRSEGQDEEREARGPEKGNIRGLVKDRYCERAQEALAIATQADAVIFAQKLTCELEEHFTEPTLAKFAAILKDIDKRTDWKATLATCAAKLSAITDVIHYSDIKRLPKP